MRQRGFDIDLKGDHYRNFILQVMDQLERADYLIKSTARSEQNTEVPIYRLRIEKIIWKLGDGQTVKADVIKRRSYKDQAPKPNKFFREMYRRDFSTTKRLRAEDHTGSNLARTSGKTGKTASAPSGISTKPRHSSTSSASVANRSVRSSAHPRWSWGSTSVA